MRRSRWGKGVQGGATQTEVVLIVSLVAVLAILAVTLFGRQLAALFQRDTRALQGQPPAGSSPVASPEGVATPTLPVQAPRGESEDDFADEQLLRKPGRAHPPGTVAVPDKNGRTLLTLTRGNDLGAEPTRQFSTSPLLGFSTTGPGGKPGTLVSTPGGGLIFREDPDPKQVVVGLGPVKLDPNAAVPTPPPVDFSGPRPAIPVPAPSTGTPSPVPPSPPKPSPPRPAAKKAEPKVALNPTFEEILGPDATSQPVARKKPKEHSILPPGAKIPPDAEIGPLGETSGTLVVPEFDRLLGIERAQPSPPGPLTPEQAVVEGVKEGAREFVVGSVQGVVEIARIGLDTGVVGQVEQVIGGITGEPAQPHSATLQKVAQGRVAELAREGEAIVKQADPIEQFKRFGGAAVDIISEDPARIKRGTAELTKQGLTAATVVVGELGEAGVLAEAGEETSVVVRGGGRGIGGETGAAGKGGSAAGGGEVGAAGGTGEAGVADAGGSARTPSSSSGKAAGAADDAGKGVGGTEPASTRGPPSDLDVPPREIPDFEPPKPPKGVPDPEPPQPPKGVADPGPPKPPKGSDVPPPSDPEPPTLPKAPKGVPDEPPPSSEVPTQKLPETGPTTDRLPGEEPSPLAKSPQELAAERAHAAKLEQARQAARDGKLKTKGLEPGLEEFDRDHRVRDLSKEPPGELARRRVTVKDGKLLDANGNPLDTQAAETAHNPGSGRAIFVVDRHGNLFVELEQKVGEFHHSSFLGPGEEVAAAGEIEVVDGKLVKISNESGHFKPTGEFVDQAVTQLEAQGVDVSQVTREVNVGSSKGTLTPSARTRFDAKLEEFRQQGFDVTELQAEAQRGNVPQGQFIEIFPPNGGKPFIRFKPN
ncbi:MAG: hypothetical protein HYZ53_22585 [Planctomycetes bacterium]|nr:hypothetical protein [Planctomycetota bacterium]